MSVYRPVQSGVTGYNSDLRDIQGEIVVLEKESIVFWRKHNLKLENDFFQSHMYGDTTMELF